VFAQRHNAPRRYAAHIIVIEIDLTLDVREVLVFRVEEVLGNPPAFVVFTAYDGRVPDSGAAIR